MSGAEGVLIDRLPAARQPCWLRYSFSLTEVAGWRVFNTTQLAYTDTAPVADLALLGSVLGNLSGVYIATD